MKLLTVLNPNAGNGRAKSRFAALRRQLEALFELEVHTTAAPEHAIELARNARMGGATHFLSVGGDGTTFEVVNGIQQADLGLGVQSPATVAILPLGTGNSFMRDVHVNGVASAMTALAQFAQTGVAFPCDLLRLEHAGGTLYSFNQLGLGFVADAGDLTNKKYKSLGVLGYVAAVLERTIQLNARQYRFALDGTPYNEQATLIAICNSRCTGGTMKMAPDARIDDNHFDVVTIDAISRFRLLSCFPKIFAGSHIHLPEVHTTRAQTMTFDLERELPTIVDGEIRHIRLQKIDILPKAISFVGNAYP